MPLIHEIYRFENEAPAVNDIVERAERLGGLALKRTSPSEESADLEFECISGVVKVRRVSDRVYLTAYFGDAPVLLDLLGLTLEDSGGQLQSGDAPATIELPLSESAVISATHAHRTELRRLSRRANRMLALVVTAALGLVVIAVWLARAWLSA